MNQLDFGDADIKIQIQTNSPIENKTNNEVKYPLSFVDLPLYGLEASYATHYGTANQTLIGNNEFVYGHEKGCILRKNSIIISKCEKGKVINGRTCQQTNPNRLFNFLIVLKNKDINPQSL